MTDAEIKIGGETSELDAALQKSDTSVKEFANQAANAFKEMSSQISGNLGTITSALTGVFQAGSVAGLLEGIKGIGEGLASLGEQAEQVRNLASVLGLTTTEYAGLGAAAQASGVGSEAASRGIEKLQTTLQQARDGSAEARGKLFDLGVSLKQIQDPGFTTASLIATIGSALNSGADSARVHAAAVALLGPRYAEVVEVIKNLKGEYGSLEGAAKSVNALTDSQNAALAVLAERWNTVTTSMRNYFAGLIANASAAASSKDLTGLQQELTYYQRIAQYESGTARGDRAAQSVAAIQQQIAALGGVAAAHEKVAAAAQADATAQTTAAQASGEKERAAQINALELQIELTKSGTTQRLAAEANLYAALASMYGSDSDRAVAAYKVVEREAISVHQAEVESAERSAEMRIAAEERAAKQGLANVRAEFAAEIADAQQFFEAQEKLAKAAANQKLQAALAGINAERDALNNQGTKGNAGKELAAQESLIGQEIAAWHNDYYEPLRALAAGNQADTDALNAEELQKTRELTQQSTQLQTKAANDMRTAWQNAMKPFVSDFTSAMRSVMSGTESIGQAFKKMASEIIQSLITVGVERLAQHELTLLLNKLEQKSNAATAGSGAMSSAASIPGIGWILAPLVGAETYGSALSFASAAGGYDIPAGLNPMVQAHSREMILPSSLGDVIRSRVGDGGPGGRDFHLHASINAVDGRSVRRLFEDNRSSLHGTIRDTLRGLNR